MIRIFAAVWVCAIVAFATAPSRAADAPDFTFNVHVKADNLPANAVSIEISCLVTSDNGTSVGGNTFSNVKNMRSMEGDMTVEIRQRIANVDPRIYKKYRCMFLVATNIGQPSSPSKFGMTAPNDGVMEGMLPAQ